MGAANIAAGLFQGFAVSTSGSRTAVAEQSGAKSQLTGVVGAGLVVVLLLFLSTRCSPTSRRRRSPPSSSSPRCRSWTSDPRRCLAGPPQRRRHVAGRHRRRRPLRRAAGHRRRRRPGDPDVLPAQLVAARRGARARSTGVTGWHSVDDYPDAEQLPGIVVYRWEAPLFFANAGHLPPAGPAPGARTAARLGRPAVRGDHRRRRDGGRHARAARQRAQRRGDPPRLRRAARSPAGARPPLRADGDPGPRPLLPDGRDGGDRRAGEQHRRREHALDGTGPP